MRFTRKEWSMIVVALDNLLVDYGRTLRSAVRRGDATTTTAAHDAIARYRRLAIKAINQSRS